MGVDLGGTKMLVGVVDSEGEVRYRSLASSHGLPQQELMDLLEREVRAALEARPQAAAVGVGIPCTIDRERGVAVQAVNLDIVDLPVRDMLAERVGRPVLLDNDANVAAIGEHRFGAARGAGYVVMLTIGTGIGGGLILGGRPYRGATGAAAELGHIVVDIDGPPCQGNCPNRGCLETLASGTAIARDGREAAAAAPDSALGQALAREAEFDGALVTGAALDGDAVARDVVTAAARKLGAGLSSLANIFEPDVIVLGGGVMAAGELILGPAREELRARALAPMNETPVRAAELGADAGMIGAAVMAMTEAPPGGGES